MLRFPVLFGGLTSVLFLGGCETAQVRDLTRNSGLYQPTGHKVKHRQQRSIWIAPLQDRRTPPKADPAESMYPVVYTQDSFWDRPPGEMIDEIVREELGSSGIFASVARSRDDADWVLEPSLLAFHGAIEERVLGRRVFAQAGLHLRVWGRPAADGKRPLIREQQYLPQPLSTPARMAFLPDPHAIAGGSLRQAIALMLRDLDAGGKRLDGMATEAGFEPGKSVPWGGQGPAESGK